MDDGWSPGIDGGEDASFVRPFLGRAEAAPADRSDRRPDRWDRSPVPAPPAAPPPSGAEPDGESPAVRPYYLTRGRVGSADRRVRVETIVVARAGASRRIPAHAWEHRRLVSLAARPASVVELAVAMGVPVGVALVLVGDLARDGLIDVSAPAVAPRDDVALIRRLIDGVIAL